MSGSTMIDVAIGIAFVYLLLSLICSTLNEFVTRIIAMRSTNLEDGIRTLLSDPDNKSLEKIRKLLSNGNALQVEQGIEKLVELGGVNIGEEAKKLLILADGQQQIRKLLDNLKVSEKFYQHPLIQGLNEQGSFDELVNWIIGRRIAFFQRAGKPSYVSSRTFRLVLLDILVPQKPAGPTGFENAKELADKINENNLIGEKVKRTLLSLIDTTQKDIQTSRANIETWFDEGMELVSGWYKRKTQVIVLMLGIPMVLILNADTFAIARTLSSDSTVRSLVVAAAQKSVETTNASGTATPAPNATPAPANPPASTTPLTKLNEYEKELAQLQLPFGWCFAKPTQIFNQPLENCKVTGDPPVVTDPRQFPTSITNWLAKLIGLLFTVLAISLGAPFWFDLLSKIVNLRSAGDEPKKASEALSPQRRGE